MPQLSLPDLARLVGGRLHGDPDRTVNGVAPLETAGPDDLSFVANPRYVRYLETTRAAAVLASPSVRERIPDRLSRVEVADPHAALSLILPRLYPEERAAPGIHPTAIVPADTQLGADVSIGAYAVLGEGVRIGDRCRIGPHVVVGARCELGADTVLHSQVTLYPGVRIGQRCVIHSGARLGPDGFGFVFVAGEHRKVPQVGGCRIEDDVEVGANTTIDRGSIGDTVVGRGSKIDNLVHLGHNVRLGEQVLIVAQVGVSGSTVVGDGAVLAGQAGLIGHLSIGAGARVAAQAGVIGDVAAGETVSGYPARPHREALRASAALLRLPELMKRVQRLERLLPGRGSEGSE